MPVRSYSSTALVFEYLARSDKRHHAFIEVVVVSAIPELSFEAPLQGDAIKARGKTGG